MKILLIGAFLTLVAAKPRPDPPVNQSSTHGPNGRNRDSPIDSFENRNPEVTDDGQKMFESDLLLTAVQRDGRQAATNLWTSPVSFAISPESAGDRAAILAGIQHWRDNTCIEFNEVSYGSTVPHIEVIRRPGCWSHVGKVTSRGGQPLSIGVGCTDLGSVVHELGHAMGLEHQESRHDRDTYVTILYDNVKSGMQHFFKKRSTPYDYYSVPYDLTSIMHSGPKYNSKNDEDTIQVKEYFREGLLGQRNGLTHRDKQIISAMYNCAAGCSNPPTCQNGGFVGKNCTCVCPPNASGSDCENLNGDYYPAPDEDCGDLAMTSEGTITSPNYPNNFPANVLCWWIITAPEGQRVKVSITDMEMLQRYQTGICPWDHLALRYSGDVHSDDEKACGDELKGLSFTSTGNQFVVKFKSGDYGWYRGFSADVEFNA